MALQQQSRFGVSHASQEPNGASVIALSGQLDAHTAPELEHFLETAIRTENKAKIVLDFTSLEYISSAGLGVPMLFAFVIGLLISNFGIVLLSSVGFVSSQAREKLYVAIGAVAGLFSLFVGTIFLFGLDGVLPALDGFLPF